MSCGAVPGCLSVLHLALVLQQLNDDALICLRISKHFLVIRDLPQLTAECRGERALLHKYTKLFHELLVACYGSFILIFKNTRHKNFYRKRNYLISWELGGITTENAPPNRGRAIAVIAAAMIQTYVHLHYLKT